MFVGPLGPDVPCRLGGPLAPSTSPGLGRDERRALPRRGAGPASRPHAGRIVAHHGARHGHTPSGESPDSPMLEDASSVDATERPAKPIRHRVGSRLGSQHRCRRLERRAAPSRMPPITAGGRPLRQPDAGGGFRCARRRNAGRRRSPIPPTTKGAATRVPSEPTPRCRWSADRYAAPMTRRSAGPDGRLIPGLRSEGASCAGTAPRPRAPRSRSEP